MDLHIEYMPHAICSDFFSLIVLVFKQTNYEQFFQCSFFDMLRISIRKYMSFEGWIFQSFKENEDEIF